MTYLEAYLVTLKSFFFIKDDGDILILLNYDCQGSNIVLIVHSMSFDVNWTCHNIKSMVFRNYVWPQLLKILNKFRVKFK